MVDCNYRNDQYNDDNGRDIGNTNDESSVLSGVIAFFISMFLITVSFSTFLSNFSLYSAIAVLLYSRMRGSRVCFKYHKIYPVMFAYALVNIFALFVSGIGLPGIGKIKNVMAFLTFFLAYEAAGKAVSRLKMLFTLQAVNFILLITAILTTAFELNDIIYFSDFVNWPTRYSGLFEVSITYGEFLVMLQCISLSVLFGAPDSFGGPAGRGVFIALITTNMAALVLTYSRGPWFVMFLAIMVVLFLNRYYKALITFAVMAVFAFLIILYPPVKNNVFLDDLNLRVKSTLSGYSSGREVIYAAGIAMIRDNPIIGVGIGGVEKNYAEYVNRIEWAAAERKQMIYGHLHNLYLQLYAETGLIGFIIFLWLCGRLLYSLSFKIRCFSFGGPAGAALETAYARGVLIAFCAVLIMGFSEYNMFNNEISRILWFYCGAAFASSDVEKL